MTIEGGIASIIGTATGLRTSEGWPDSIQTPMAIVDGPQTYEDADIAGCKVAQTWEITLLLSLSAGIHRARAAMMEYLAPSGAKSIRAALYADTTLSGNAQAFVWRGIQTPPGRIQQFGKGPQAEVLIDEFYGAVLSIETVSAS